MNRRSIAAATSSKSVEWATPWDLFHRLNDQYGRDELNPAGCELDVCANQSNTKCPRYYGREVDGLKQSWRGYVCWMNPPYGRELPRWVEKAYQEAERDPDTKVISLLPARTDTSWWHEYVEPVRLGKVAGVMEFLRGRVTFEGAPYPALFPSAVVVFGGREWGV